MAGRNRLNWPHIRAVMTTMLSIGLPASLLAFGLWSLTSKVLERADQRALEDKLENAVDIGLRGEDFGRSDRTSGFFVISIAAVAYIERDVRLVFNFRDGRVLYNGEPFGEGAKQMGRARRAGCEIAHDFGVAVSGYLAERDADAMPAWSLMRKQEEASAFLEANCLPQVGTLAQDELAGGARGKLMLLQPSG